MKKVLFSNRPIATDLGLLMLRLASGGIMAYSHGWGKLQKMLSGDMSFADPIGVGEEASLILTVFAEFVCGILVALGLFTRAALVPLIITMLVAVFIVHADDPFSKQEFGLLFLIPYITIFLAGPGKFSLDKKLG
ncbi:MAG: DoxX family protein [Flavobacteriales bacterium]|nr:DoxX family protein [Flavobacteriales bacterium]MCB9205322.1 DoxX family protein [Flavobacteriales bacterium]